MYPYRKHRKKIVYIINPGNSLLSIYSGYICTNVIFDIRFKSYILIDQLTRTTEEETDRKTLTKRFLYIYIFAFTYYHSQSNQPNPACNPSSIAQPTLSWLLYVLFTKVNIYLPSLFHSGAPFSFNIIYFS